MLEVRERGRIINSTYTSLCRLDVDAAYGGRKNLR